MTIQDKVWCVVKDKDSKGGAIEVIFGYFDDIHHTYADGQKLAFFDDQEQLARWYAKTLRFDKLNKLSNEE